MSKVDGGLIVVDVQNDFCPGGALEVKDGDKVVPVINSIADKFEKVVATQDWHPQNHLSFASNHEGKKTLDVVNLKGIQQVLWPDHCVQGTKGADFHPDLDTTKFDLIIRKGTNPEIDSYSAFFENDRKTRTGLEGYIKDLGLNKVYVCGLATDYCVFYTAMDSAKIGFETYVIIDACRGVDFPKGSIEKAVEDMKANGIKIITSKEI